MIDLHSLCRFCAKPATGGMAAFLICEACGTPFITPAEAASSPPAVMVIEAPPAQPFSTFFEPMQQAGQILNVTMLDHQDLPESDVDPFMPMTGSAVTGTAPATTRRAVRATGWNGPGALPATVMPWRTQAGTIGFGWLESGVPPTRTLGRYRLS